MYLLITFLTFLQIQIYPTGSYHRDSILYVSYNDSIVKYDIINNKILDIKEIKFGSDFNPESYLWMNQYYIHTGGGLVYKNIFDSIQRVDNSFDHKLQLSSLIFERNDSIYRYGGYGFFSTRNFLTYFDKKINEWETLSIRGDVYPIGIFNGVQVNTYNKFIFVGGHKIDPNDRSRTILNYDVFEFDFEKRSWSKIGISSKNYLRSKRNFQTKEGFIYFDDNVEIIDLFRNKVTVIEKDVVSRKISGSLINPFVYQDTIYYLNDPDIMKLNKISIKDFINVSMIKEETFLKSDIIHSKFIKIFFLSVFIILGFLSLILFLVRDKILVFKSIFIYRFRKLRFSKIEESLLKNIITSSSVSNQLILKLFDEYDLDLGTITRRKNEMINELNHKLKFLLNIDSDLIILNKSSSDRRNIYYSLDRNFFFIIL